MPTNRKVIDFKIHNLTEEQFQELKEAGQIDPNAIYCTPDETVANFEEINTEIEALKDKGGIPLLSPMWADHTLNDISWLNADTFSWQSGDVYVAAYEHLFEESNGKEGVSETIAGITVWFVQADDGHKICPASEEANVQALYEKTGVAWYYIIDEANKQFKLPRTKFGFTGLRDSVGKYVPAGLPNITGQFYVPATYGSATSSGVFNAYNGGSTGSTNTAAKAGDLTVQFNASRSSSVYGNSSTVQPPATQMYLYFYVGNFERDALEQTAGITSEQLNNKADVSDVVELQNNKANISDVVELQNNKLDKSAEISLVPTGSVTAFAGTTPPTGWLKCDGSAISRTTYAKLFAAIGTTYGTGDGSTTFNLPTQSVLPLGTSAPVSLTANGTLQIKNSVGGLENVVKSSSGDNSGRRELVVNGDGNGQNSAVQYGSGITGTANLANATGAKAIVCIKY